MRAIDAAHVALAAKHAKGEIVRLTQWRRQLATRRALTRPLTLIVGTAKLEVWFLSLTAAR